MRTASIDRKFFISAAVLIALTFGVQAAHAQFTAPTCTPPNCSPAVIQNISIVGAGQNASINVTGGAKIGATFQAGASAPVLAVVGDNLFYGNVGATSVNGSLMLLQFGAADRLRVSLAGQMQLPLGTAALPSYTFLGDTNNGLYSPAADQTAISTGGAQRMVWSAAGTTVSSGVLTVPVGSAAAPSITFAGDANTGIYHSAADTMNFVTNGVSAQTISSTGTVIVPGTLVVQTALIAPVVGDGSGITNINADNITSGTLNEARLTSNVALLNRNGQNFTGTNNFSAASNTFLGTHTGNGTGLTALNATQLTSGTLPSGRLAGTYSGALTLSNNNTYSGMSTFGSAAIVVGAAQNLIYGNIDTTSTGSLLLLQKESVDRFRVDQAGNVTVAGTGAFTGNVTVGGQSVCRADGTNCPATINGNGTLNTLTKFTPNGSTVGDSQIQDDGSTIGVGIAPQAAKLYVNGTISANNTISTYQVAAGGIGLSGQVVGVGSTGVTGTGGSYGVYGSAGTGRGVYGIATSAGGTGKGVEGYHNGTGDGVFGSSAGGWGGHFSSLWVNGQTAFDGNVTITGGATLRLGVLGSENPGTSGEMYYNSTSNTFRCNMNGTWADCGGGIAGSGTNNFVPRFTPNGTTLGNSQIQDDGTSVGIGSVPSASAKLSVNGSSYGVIASANNAGGGTGLSGTYSGAGTGQGVLGYATNVTSGRGVLGYYSGNINLPNLLGTGAGVMGASDLNAAIGVSGIARGAATIGVAGTVTAYTGGANTFGVYANNGSTQAVTNYGVSGDSVGTNTGTNVGGSFNAANGTNNYALVTGGGNVGIGIATPNTFKLQVAGAVGPNADNTYDLGSAALRWKTLHVGPGSVVVHNDASNTLKATLGFSGATAQLATDAATPLQITTGANSGINVSTAGNVGVGTAATTARLQVNADWDGSNGAVTLAGDRPSIRMDSTQGSGSNEKWLIHVGSSPAGGLSFYEGTNGSAWNQRMAFLPTGEVGINTTPAVGQTLSVAQSANSSYAVYANSSGAAAVGTYSTAYGAGGMGVYGGGTLYGLYGTGGTYGVYGFSNTGWAVYASGKAYISGDLDAPNNQNGAGSGWISCGQNLGYCYCPNGSFVGVVYHESNTNLAQALQVYCYKP